METLETRLSQEGSLPLPLPPRPAFIAPANKHAFDSPPEELLELLGLAPAPADGVGAGVVPTSPSSLSETGLLELLSTLPPSDSSDEAGSFESLPAAPSVPVWEEESEELDEVNEFSVLDSELLDLMETGATATPAPTPLPVLLAVPVPGFVKTRAVAEAKTLLAANVKPRKTKTAVPATAKTPFYHDKRKRNNTSAAKCRAKDRELRAARKLQHAQATLRNATLRAEVTMLETKLEQLQAKAFESSVFGLV